jgi:hypothetical protein
MGRHDEQCCPLAASSSLKQGVGSGLCEGRGPLNLLP